MMFDLKEHLHTRLNTLTGDWVLVPSHEEALAGENGRIMVCNNFTSLHIGLNQRGVGGDNSWVTLPHNAFLLQLGKYEYGYVISPQAN